MKTIFQTYIDLVQSQNNLLLLYYRLVRTADIASQNRPVGWMFLTQQSIVILKQLIKLHILR